ncbi:MAG: DUF3488 and DUF4129 domain-containing transglutaminase family protein [Myxococcaceae bacterium]
MTAPPSPVWRLRLRDAAAGTAFGSMAISGQLPLAIVAVFALGLVLALMQRRVLAHRVGLSTAAVFAASLVLILLVLMGRLDLVVSASVFVALLTVQRLLVASTLAVNQQVHLTSVLMTAGGAALSADLLYALFLLTFAGLATFSLTAGVLVQAAAPGETLPTRPAFRRVGMGFAFAVLGAMAFFVFFPRLSLGIAARRSAGLFNTATSGFTGNVRLGGSGTLKTDPRLVARIKLVPDRGLTSLEAYWPGRALDTFDGREWKTLGNDSVTAERLQLRGGGDTLQRQEIELLPAYGSPTLIALDTPVVFFDAIALQPTRSTRTAFIDVRNVEVRAARSAPSYQYQAYSKPDVPTLLRAGDEEVDLSRYLQLPEGLEARVSTLAQEIATDATEPREIASELTKYLKGRYRYSLELPGATTTDPLPDFLFRRKAGHCEDFATALAVLLRIRGVPSRVVTGFFGGERMGDGYVLRAADAHAWVQAWVPGEGFITLDATPEAFRSGRPQPLLAWVVRAYASIESSWQAWVVDYSFRDQMKLTRAAAQGVSAPTRWPKLSRRALAVVWALGVTLIALGAWLLRPRQRAVPEAIRLLLDIERALAQVGARRRETEGIEETLEWLRRTGHPLAPAVSPLVQRYLEARFGARPLRTGERRHLVGTLEAALRVFLTPRASA